MTYIQRNIRMHTGTNDQSGTRLTLHYSLNKIIFRSHNHIVYIITSLPVNVMHAVSDSQCYCKLLLARTQRLINSNWLPV